MKDLVLIGIDYGRAHVGVSVATTPLAEPIETVVMGKFDGFLSKLVNELKPDGLVVGISEGEMAEEIRGFAKGLQEKFSLPVFLHDETLSSLETRSKVAMSGMKKRRREGKIDHLVAAGILQDFLDTYDALEEVPNTARIIRHVEK